jgi:hypothetical protein
MADSPVSVCIINESTRYSDADIAPWIAAVEEDRSKWGPIWGLPPAKYFQVPKGDPPLAGMRQRVFLDNTDQASALGYHFYTSEGLSLGKIFVETTIRDGQTPSRVFSHEDGEDWVDENINRYTGVLSDGKDYCVEIGDLTALDSQGRWLNGVLLSDLALPRCYWPTQYTGPYSVGETITAPLPDVLPAEGCYKMWRGGAGYENMAPEMRPHFILSPPITSHHDFMAMQPQFGNRRHRRLFPNDERLRSTVAVR